MLFKREIRKYDENMRVWLGRYRNLVNLPHWHTDNEILYVDQGGAEVYVSGHVYPLNAGQCMFIASGDNHYIRAHDDSIISFVIFDGELTETMIGNRTLDCPILQHDHGFRELFSVLSDEMTRISVTPPPIVSLHIR